MFDTFWDAALIAHVAGAAQHRAGLPHSSSSAACPALAVVLCLARRWVRSTVARWWLQRCHQRLDPVGAIGFRSPCQLERFEGRHGYYTDVSSGKYSTALLRCEFWQVFNCIVLKQIWGYILLKSRYAAKQQDTKKVATKICALPSKRGKQQQSSPPCCIHPRQNRGNKNVN